MIGLDLDGWYGSHRTGWNPVAWEDFRAGIEDPATVHAMCEDYRAGLGVDRAEDDADRAAGQRVACPVLVLRGARDDLPDLYGDVLGVAGVG